MKTRISLPAGVAIFVALALAGLMGVFAFNAPQPAEAQDTDAANADLKSLKVMDGSADLTLDPPFEADKTFYEVDTVRDLNSVTVAAEPYHEGAMVQLPGANGAVPVTSGVNDMAVVVTSADGSGSKVYFIRLTSYGANDLKALAIYKGTSATDAVDDNKVSLEPDFTYDGRTYTATVDNGDTEVFVQATPADSGADLESQGKAAAVGDADPADLGGIGDITVTDGVGGQAITGLTVGVNTLEISVNGAKYTIKITQKAAAVPSKNAYLKELEVSFGDHTAALVSEFTPKTTLYSATVPFSAGIDASSTVTVKARPDDSDLDGSALTLASATGTVSTPFAATEYEGEIHGLRVGANEVTIRVQAEDSAVTKTYYVYITRKPAEVNDLSVLSIGTIIGTGTVTMKPSFRSDHPTYEASGPSTVTGFTVTATAADTTTTTVALTATKKADNTAVTVSTGAISGLEDGEYVVTARVSTSGKTDKVYRITVTVGVDTPEASENADLESLTVTTDGDDSVEFAQGMFMPGTDLYTATVPNSVEAVEVTATPAHEKATLVSSGTADGTALTASDNGIGAMESGTPQEITGLAVGVNTIDITVTPETAEAGDAKRYTIAIQREPASDDAKLSSLTVMTDGGARVGLTPAFKPGTFGYTAMVAPTVSSVTVNAKPAHRYAKVESPGMVSLDPGMTQLVVLVTAENGDKQGYLVRVTKDAPSTDATLESLTVSLGEGEDVVLSPAFQSSATAYHGSVRHSAETVMVNAVAAEGATITSGTGSHSLTAGTTSIRVMVTAEDGTTTMTYTVLISKLPAISDATLSHLDLWLYPMTDPMTEVGDLTKTFMADTMDYTVMAGNSVESVKVRAITTHMGATAMVTAMSGGAEVTVTDNVVPLAVGDTVITATVTAEDESTMAYTVTVTRASTDATLSALSLSDGTLSPAFEAGTMAYTAMVDYAVDSVTVTATASHSGAAISGDGMHSLTVGENTINVVVTAEDGMPMMTYTIVITRDATSTDATLSALSLSAGTLTPEFTAGTTAYTAMVDYAVKSVTVTATASDTMASVSGDGMHDLGVGANTITVTVTAADGSTMAYTITVTRAAGTPVERFDANKDGAIDAAEVRAAIEDFLSDNPTLDAAGVGAVIDKFLE